MSYECDTSEPVPRYHAWERGFERGQTPRRALPDTALGAVLSPWSLVIGLMAAMREATDAGQAKNDPARDDEL